MARVARFGPAVASAALLLLAFPPFNLGLLALVALVPWLGSLLKPGEGHGRFGWKSGYLFGLIYGLGQFHWLSVFVTKWTAIWLGGLVWVVCTVLFALYFGLSGWLMARSASAQKAWMIPLIWAGVEVFRSYIPVFAFPWGQLAAPLWPYALLNQFAYFGSIYAVSAVCVTVSLVTAIALEGYGWMKVRGYVIAVAVAVGLSLVRMSMHPETKKVVVDAIQPGVDMAFGDRDSEASKLREAIEPLVVAAEINGADLVVLPEGVADATKELPQVPFRLDGKVPVLFGAQRGEKPSYQSAFLWDGKISYIDKTRLVIFGEFVPGRGVIPYPESFNLPAGDLQAGTEGVRAMDTDKFRVGPILCFEALFPDIAYRQALNGSQLLAVMSIDDWYVGTTAPEMLKAGAIWRSIENGTPLVRSASTGATLATNDHGAVVAEVPTGGREQLRVELQVPTRPAGFRGLAAFPLVSLAALLGSIGLTLTVWRRSGSAKQSADPVNKKRRKIGK